jgi:methylphosphotriester-DNA--protein-cysteine methyltransferase
LEQRDDETRAGGAAHRHFEAITALSPLQYQERVRLLHVRNMLIAGEGNTTSVAFGVGYERPIQSTANIPVFLPAGRVPGRGVGRR